MRFAKVVLCATAFVFAMSHFGTVQAAETIKIGVAGAHSGDLSGYGIGTLNAAKIIETQVNESGGIAGGKMIEVVPQDDQCKPELATNAATKLISDNVKVVIGHICTGATNTALPLYTEAKVISISPSSTNPDLTQSGRNPYFFRTIASDDDQARIAVRALEDVIKAKKVAILHDKTEYGRGYADYVQEFLKKNDKVKVVLFEGITIGAVDYSSVVQKVRSSGAEAVVFGGYDPEASKIISQMRQRKINIPLVSCDGIRVDSYIRLAKQNAEGTYASGTKDYSDLPLYKEAVENHQKMFGTPPPTQFYLQGYAAMLAAVNAIDKAGGDQDLNKLLDALHNEYVDTPIGKIRFDQKGDAEGVGFALFVVKDGKWVQVDE